MQIQAEMDRMHKTHGPQFKQKPPPLSTLADAAGRAVAPRDREEREPEDDAAAKAV